MLGQGGEQVTEYSGSSAWVHTNAIVPGGPTATYNGSNTYFALTDWLGTKRAEVAAGAGGCVTSFVSVPFGNEMTSSGSCADATEHHFTGKERDAESGNDYFGARYYSSAMGRFLSPDWSAEAEPVPYAKMDDPQTLNLYGYLRNNPLAGVDADGHDGPLSRMKDDQQLLQSAMNLTSNPYVKGGGEIMLGIGLVATAAVGDVPGGIAGGLILANAALGGTVTVAHGTATIIGAASPENAEGANQAKEVLDATSTLPGLATTALSGGNVKAGQVVSTVTNVASLAADPKGAVKNVATAADAARTAKDTQGLAQEAKSALSGALAPTPTAPNTPKPPAAPSCAYTGHC